MHLEPREKHPFKDAEAFLLKRPQDSSVFVGWRWPHLTSWNECRNYNQGFLLNTIGMDGVE